MGSKQSLKRSIGQRSVEFEEVDEEDGSESTFERDLRPKKKAQV